MERRTSRGYQFRQRHLSNIMSTIEAREKEEGKEGETQRVRLLLVSVIFNNTISCKKGLCSAGNYFFYKANHFMVWSEFKFKHLYQLE